VITPNIRAYEMRDALYDALHAEMHAGGKLAGLVSITKAAQFAVEMAPALCVSLTGWDPPQPYGQRTRQVRVNFELLLAASSSRTLNRVANLADAQELLRPVIDAGPNGLVPLLNAPAEFAFANSGIAIESAIGEGRFYPEIREGEGQATWMYFALHYSAVTIYSF
jgi:hypothetical protein